MSHHPSVQHLLQYFRYEHLPEHLQAVSKDFHDLAKKTADRSIGNPSIEATVALRKLLEAKDAAVRAAI